MAGQNGGIEQIMRVQMDEESMRGLLQPILDEVNNLRKRVAQLERDAAATTLWAEYVDHHMAALLAFMERMQDDGK